MGFEKSRYVETASKHLRYHGQRVLEEAFPKIKAERLMELEYRLELFRMHEEHRRDEVDGLDIEHALRRVADWCGARKTFCATSRAKLPLTSVQKRDGCCSVGCWILRK